MHHAMSQIRRWSRMRRFLHLRRAEDDLQRFNSRLDTATQAFTVGNTILQHYLRVLTWVDAARRSNPCRSGR